MSELLEKLERLAASYDRLATYVRENELAEHPTLSDDARTVRAAKAELDRLTAERDEAVSRIPTVPPDVDPDKLILNAYGRRCYDAGRQQAEAENARLKAALEQAQADATALRADLREYGRHAEGCSAAVGDYRCKCGWDTVEAALRGEGREEICRQCGKPESVHCDMDEPGLDHPAGCELLHHEFKPKGREGAR